METETKWPFGGKKRRACPGGRAGKGQSPHMSNVTDRNVGLGEDETVQTKSIFDRRRDPLPLAQWEGGNVCRMKNMGKGGNYSRALTEYSNSVVERDDDDLAVAGQQ